MSVSPEVARVLLAESREAGEAYIAYLRSQAQPRSFFVDNRSELEDSYVQRNRSAYAEYLKRYAEEASEAEKAFRAYVAKSAEKEVYETRVTFRNTGDGMAFMGEGRDGGWGGAVVAVSGRELG